MDHLDLVKAVITEYHDRARHPNFARPFELLYPLYDGFRCSDSSAGVYMFFDARREWILYVGMADRLDRRLNNKYFRFFAPTAPGGPCWGAFEEWNIKPAWMKRRTEESKRTRVWLT